jgi:hypothetical protein
MTVEPPQGGSVVFGEWREVAFPRMPTKNRPDLDAEIDALFRLPLAEFTSERNAVAARLKKEGRAIDAERVKSLPKPSAPAWAVNQLYWQNPREIDRLHTVGAQAGKAQTGRSKNADLRELLGEKRRMVAELMGKAASILKAAGHAASPDTMRRVSATIESLAVWGAIDGAPKAGRLTAELEPPGFDALAAATGGANIDSAKVLAFRKPKPAEEPAVTRARAREAVQAAEKVLREARKQAAAAEAALAKANGRTASLEKQKQEIEARYLEAKEEARTASKEASNAAAVVADAERSLAKAKAALE